MGRREEYLSLLERSLEQIDPVSPHQNLMLAYRFMWFGEWSQAIEAAQITLELEPEDSGPYHILSVCYERLGMEQEALEMSLRTMEDEKQIARIREVFLQEGIRGARRYTSSAVPETIFRAMLFAESGDKDRAFTELDQIWSLPLGGLENAPSNRRLDSLRSDPRFEELLKKQNLPEDAIQRHLVLR